MEWFLKRSSQIVFTVEGRNPDTGWLRSSLVRLIVFLQIFKSTFHEKSPSTLSWCSLLNYTYLKNIKVEIYYGKVHQWSIRIDRTIVSPLGGIIWPIKSDSGFGQWTCVFLKIVLFLFIKLKKFLTIPLITENKTSKVCDLIKGGSRIFLGGGGKNQENAYYAIFG